MRIRSLALAGMLVLTVPVASHAIVLESNKRPANPGLAPGTVVMVRDGGGWDRRSGVSGSHPTAGPVRQWNGGWFAPNWGANRFYGGGGPAWGPGFPTYWVWGPSGGAFDYPFADWRGPTGGWGNP